MENCSFPNGQYNSLSYHVKMGGRGRGGVCGKNKNRIRKGNLKTCPTPWDHYYCRISSKLHKSGRLAVKKLKRPFRVEIPSTSISENLSNLRKTRDLSFCSSTVSATSMVHCMETRSIQSGNRCNAENLVQSVPLCFPTFFKDKQGLKKDIPRPSEKNVDCSSHNAVPSMVSDPSENVNIEIFCHTTTIKPSGSGISVASKLVSGTRGQGSLSNYNLSWSKRASWCGERKLDPFL